jgi:hypothetical protein
MDIQPLKATLRIHAIFKHSTKRINILGDDLDRVIVGAVASATIHHDFEIANFIPLMRYILILAV